MRMYLKEAREKLGYTQSKVAKFIGISPNYYCDIENSVRQKDIKAQRLLKLSDVLKVPINDMLREERNIRELCEEKDFIAKGSGENRIRR